jgi:hypothetical protein
MKRIAEATVMIGTYLCIAVVFCGCSFESEYAVVIDGVISARNPPIRNDRSFVITAVDGTAFRRERMRPFEDMYPGVLVEPGTHSFKVNVEIMPHPPPLPPPKVMPYETSFSGTVLAGHRYLIASNKGLPELVETH